jgi:hypothetical protein
MLSSLYIIQTRLDKRHRILPGFIGTSLHQSLINSSSSLNSFSRSIAIFKAVSKNADELIQENGSESDKEEDREPSIPIRFLKERERAARQAVMYPQHLEWERH